MLKKLLVTSALLTSGAAIVSANTDAFCLSADHFYAGASALAGKSGDFKEFGGAAHVGYRVSEKVGVEFEAGYIAGTAKRNWNEKKNAEKADQTFNFASGKDENCKNNPALAGNADGITACEAQWDADEKIKGKGYTGTFTKMKAKMNQIPLMVNVRFMDSVNAFTYYVGAGLGVDIMGPTVTSQDYEFVKVTTKDANGKDKVEYKQQAVPGVKAVKKKNKSTARLAGQVFAGVGYAFTEQFSVSLGARCLIAPKYEIKDADTKKVIFSTKTLSPMAELSFNYSF